MLATGAALAVTAGGCGGEGLAAPRPPERQRCPSTDAQLAGLYAMLDAGQLSHLAGVLATDLDADARGDLVAALLRLVGAFEPGTFAALGGLSDAVTDGGELVALVADAARWVADSGPASPYPAALGGVRRLLQTCEGPPALQLVREVLADDALITAALTLLSGDDLGGALGALQIDGETGRPAVRALARNVLVAFAAPTFDVDALLGLLGLVVDVEAPPFDALDAGLRRLLGPGPNLAAASGLASCLLAVDEELSLVDLVFDLFTDPALDLGGRALAMLPGASDGAAAAPLLPDSLAAAVDDALGFLVGDAPARAALADVLTVLLQDARAPAVLRDLAEFLEADILGDVVRLLAAIATRTCPP